MNRGLDFLIKVAGMCFVSEGSGGNPLFLPLIFQCLSFLPCIPLNPRACVVKNGLHLHSNLCYMHQALEPSWQVCQYNLIPLFLSLNYQNLLLWYHLLKSLHLSIYCCILYCFIVISLCFEDKREVSVLGCHSEMKAKYY